MKASLNVLFKCDNIIIGVDTMRKHIVMLASILLFLFACSHQVEDSNEIIDEPVENGNANATVINFLIDDSVVNVLAIDQADDFILFEPEVPNGYVFLGWFFEGQLFEINYIDTHSKIDLIAGFEPITYSISYSLNEGTLVSEAPETITIEDRINLPVVQKQGYDFLGWYGHPDFIGEPILILEDINKDIELYARFEKAYPSPPHLLLRNEIIDVDLRANSGSFIDQRFYLEEGMYWESYYYAYYADGHVIEFHIQGSHLIYQTIEHAYYYGRLLGWLPEAIRLNINKINLVNNHTFDLDFNDLNELSIYLDFDSSVSRNNKSQLGIFISPLLEIYYQQFEDEVLENYEDLFINSKFYISEFASRDSMSDFVESYVYYLLISHLQNDLTSNLTDYEKYMQERITFFETHGLGKTTYSEQNTELIKSNMKQDTFLFHGTVWDIPFLFDDKDPSAYLSIEYQGMGVRMTYDHRDTPNGYQNRNTYLFRADYQHGNEIEFQLEEAFDFETAQKLAEKYANRLGKLPAMMFYRLETYTIFKAPFVAGGGSGNIVVGHDLINPITNHPAFDEMVLHEAAHASLDWDHGGLMTSERWLNAASQDDYYVSHYASLYPFREDIAETINVYLLYRFRSSRADVDLIAKIERLIPNRIAYFDEYDFSFPE